MGSGLPLTDEDKSGYESRKHSSRRKERWAKAAL